MKNMVIFRDFPCEHDQKLSSITSLGMGWATNKLLIHHDQSWSFNNQPENLGCNYKNNHYFIGNEL